MADVGDVDYRDDYFRAAVALATRGPDGTAVLAFLTKLWTKLGEEPAQPDSPPWYAPDPWRAVAAEITRRYLIAVR